MKKILMLLESKFPPDVRVENEMEALTQAGFEVHLACYRRPGEPETEVTPLGTIHRETIPVWRYKSSVGARKFPFYFAYWRRRVARLFAAGKFDAVHVHDLPLARVGLEAGLRYGARFVLDLHEIWPALLQVSAHTHTLAGRLLSSDRQWRAYERRMTAQADRVVVVVEESKARLTGFGVDPDKITVVSNTLNINSFDLNDACAEAPVPGTPLRMLYVGGVTAHRGLQDVLDAIRLLKDRGVPVVFDLVGDGAYLPQLRAQAARLGITEEVNFHGFRRYTEIAGLYRQAQVAVIPHVKSEHTDHTVPHKIFQYMYARTPMLVSSCNPLVRIVEETESGLSYTSGDARSLCEGLLQLSGAETWRRLTLHGREAVEQRYNWQRDGARLVAMYHQLLAE